MTTAEFRTAQPWYVIALANLVRVGEYRRDALWPAVLTYNLTMAGVQAALRAARQLGTAVETYGRAGIITEAEGAELIARGVMTGGGG